jgi:hypothetical protein
MKIFVLSLIHRAGAIQEALKPFGEQGVVEHLLSFETSDGVAGFRILIIGVAQSEHSDRIANRAEYGAGCVDHFVHNITAGNVFWPLRTDMRLDPTTGKFLNKPTTQPK